VLLSRRSVAPPHDARVQCVQADVSSAASLASCAALRALRSVSGIFHLAGVLDDGLIVNMTPERLHTAVQPKAGLLSLLELSATRAWRPQWVVAASSTSSLLGYAGQSNYCAANGLLDHLATFGAPRAGPRVLTLNFGPWGEVGMAREGTKAHQLSLQSGELPMASSAAVACIAEALRQLQLGMSSGQLAPAGDVPVSQACTPLTAGLQFAVADVEWWRSPWPSHPLLQGVMHRLPPAPPQAPEPAEAEAEGRAKTSSRRKSGSSVSGGQGDADGGAADKGSNGGSLERVEGFLRNRISVWQPDGSLTDLGLDSLDLVQLRNAFQKGFKCSVPLAVFTNAQQTLAELISKLAEAA